MRLPDHGRQFILQTDVSDVGVGAVLLQEFDGKKFPVAYASKKLSESEKRYLAIEKECLTIVWSIKRFRQFLQNCCHT